jgi:malonyl CoA-acyl carrier protein transacylase
MSGFEIVAVNPPLELVGGLAENSSVCEIQAASTFGVVAAALRAGYTGLIDLSLVNLNEAKELQRLKESFAAMPVASPDTKQNANLGIKFDIDHFTAVEELLKLFPSINLLVVTAYGEQAKRAEKIAQFKKRVQKFRSAGGRLFVEAVSSRQAQLAAELTADGVIAKGHEADGIVGDQTTFVLVQQLLKELSVPVFAYGGIGPHTAAACYAAGASGVVLSSQLLLTKEVQLPLELQNKIEQLDGTETVLVDLVPERTAFGEPQFACRLLAKSNHARLENFAGKSLSELSNELSNSFKEEPLHWLFPIGQDVSFARQLAGRYKSVAGVLDAIKAAAIEHVTLAKQLAPLAPASPLAKSHGTAYPIVQGAMTRVSDTADFAFNVSHEGGLPFLALALMRKDEVETLLAQTTEKLGKLPWGVGILGFVPSQLRQEQLEVIEKYKPPFALIAGGRPDQAKFLEDRGIKTYLHVPSPMLLSSFIEMGSRRFIFEGKECGGHVGPRSSFVLWETMIERILESIGPREDGSAFHVLFAGGVHDARSAAMVAAMAAPLSQRGVKIGVLMGTAYLFTKEAVSTGAIVEKFQKSAISCQETVLLETGPGHAIRCINSPYKQTFDECRDDLVAKKKSRDEIREELELMNLGRLRIASKGLTRAKQLTKEQVISEMSKDNTTASNDKLAAVAEDKQWSEGMYMIGQVAAIHDSVITIKQLHEDVSIVGSELIKQIAERASTVPQALPEPSEAVAIIGMSCLFPKANDLETFWRNILNKVDTIEEVPISQWDWRNFYDEDPLAKDKIYSKWGGFLQAIEFDPTKYGIPPSSLNSIDPMQVLLLEVTDAALKDAGYDKRPFAREKTSVVLANAGHGPVTAFYSLRSMLGWKLSDLDDATKKKLEDRLPEWTEDSFPGYLGNVTAGRVANRFDLGGVNFSVDAACASSIAALHIAVAELRNKQSDVVLLSATDTHNQPGDYLSFSKTHAFSGRGRCRTFDATADGIVISEGMAMLVLKRLSDAERDGDRIYAVIKGVGGSSDGRDLSLTAPRPAGQKKALERAYLDAQLSPSTVTLVEAHGTGTVAGDRAEVEALRQVFEAEGAQKRHCAIGSVKTMIGHTKAAAGLASLIKVAKALHHKVLPPTMGVTVPNPSCQFSESPFYINSETRPWLLPGNLPGSEDLKVRRAGVSAFGFGGTNFHAVLEEYKPHVNVAEPAAEALLDNSQVFVFGARSRAELIKQLAHFGESVKRNSTDVVSPDADRLFELARAHHLRNLESRQAVADADSTPNYNLAVVASSIADLESKLSSAKSDLLDEQKKQIKDMRGVYYQERGKETGKIAFLFPGQGSQQLNMLKDLTLEFSAVRDVLENADKTLSEQLEKNLSEYIYPPPSFSPEEEKKLLAALTDTRIAQPAVGACDVAVLKLLKQFGVSPDMVAGHSYGEYVALYAAGTISFNDLLLISELRGRLLGKTDEQEAGTMAAVSCSLEKLQELLPSLKGISLANINSLSQTVIAGDIASIENAIETLKSQSISAKRINVSQAFHSPFVKKAALELKKELSKFSFSAPSIPVFNNTDGNAYNVKPAEVAEKLSLHTISPVNFVQMIRNMHAQGARTFVEVGPGGVLSGLVGSILADQEFTSITVDRVGRNGRLAFLHVLAQLAGLGVNINLSPLFRQRLSTKVDAAGAQKDAAPVHKGPKLKYLVDSVSIKRIDKIQTETKAITSSAKTESSPTSQTSISKRVPMPKNGADHNGSTQQTKPQVPNTVPTPVERPASAVTPGALPMQAPKVAGNLPLPYQQQQPYQPQMIQPAALNGRQVEQVMLQFQQTMLQMTNQFLETQQRVMLAYLQGQQSNVMPGIPMRQPSLPVAPMVPSQFAPVNQLPMPILPQVAAYQGNGQNGHGEEIHPELAPQEIEANGNGHVSVLEEESSESANGSSPNESVDAEFLVDSLLDIVSQRTGYPVEMLDPTLDLEADLGIDSIKRVEILNSFRRVLPEAKKQQLEAGIEDLAGTKTLQGIIDWLRTAPPADVPHANNGSNGHGKVAAADVAKLVKGETPTNGSNGNGHDHNGHDSEKLAGLTVNISDGNGVPTYTGEIKRALVELKELPQAVPTFPANLAGQVAVITDDGFGIAPVLAKELSALGLTPVLLEHTPGNSAPNPVSPDKTTYKVDLTDSASLETTLNGVRSVHGSVHSLWHLKSADAKSNSVPSFFYLLKNLVGDISANGGNGGVTALTSIGGDFGLTERSALTAEELAQQGGVAGAIKTAAKELNPAVCKVVDCEPAILTGKATAKKELVKRLIAEHFSADSQTEIAYSGGKRFCLTVKTDELEEPALAASDFQLDEKSVVFVTGGARGITGEIVLELAKHYKPTFVVIGRSELPAPQEEAWLENLEGARALKAAIMERLKAEGSAVSIPLVEARYQKILKDREIRQYLRDIKNAGSQYEYHSVDVRDQKAFGKVIDEAYKKHGKIDVVIHGAGVIEDAYIKDKNVDSFLRVFETKVNGAFTLARHLKLDTVERLVFFSSVVGRTGNAGQIDYVSANETVNKLALALQDKVKGRAMSIMWGPWKGGMAQPELESIFASYGWAMIDAKQGRDSFINEMKNENKEHVEVLLVAELSRDSLPEPKGPKLHAANVNRIGDSGFEFTFEVGKAKDLFLQDHAFDGIPVMPMAFSLEFMAEAVKSVHPELSILTVENMDIPGGIVFDAPMKTFYISVNETRQTDGTVRLQASLRTAANRARTNFKADFVMGSAEMRQKMSKNTREKFDLAKAKSELGEVVDAPKLNEIYGQWLFHGPRFQGIQRIDLLGEKGIVGGVGVSSPAHNLSNTDGSPWQIDPILLDSSMQLGGIWARKFLDITVLPTGFKRLTRYRATDVAPLTSRIFIAPDSSTSELTCDLAIYDNSGELAILVEGLGGVGSKSLNRLGAGVEVGSES